MHGRRIRVFEGSSKAAILRWQYNIASVRKFSTILIKPPSIALTPGFVRYRIGTKAGLSSPCHGRKNFTQTALRAHLTDPELSEGLSVTFIDREGEKHRVSVTEGENLLEIAQARDLEVEGACGGSCACSTCHMIVMDNEFYGKLPDPMEDENDMLDQAEGLTETSRLGCQVIMTQNLNGLVVKLPAVIANMQVG